MDEKSLLQTVEISASVYTALEAPTLGNDGFPGICLGYLVSSSYSGQLHQPL